MKRNLNKALKKTLLLGSAMIALCAALPSQPDLQSHYSDCRGGTAVIAQELISDGGIRR